MQILEKSEIARNGNWSVGNCVLAVCYSILLHHHTSATVTGACIFDNRKVHTEIYYIPEPVCTEKEHSDWLPERSDIFLYGPLRWTPCVTTYIGKEQSVSILTKVN